MMQRRCTVLSRTVGRVPDPQVHDRQMSRQCAYATCLQQGPKHTEWTKDGPHALKRMESLTHVMRNTWRSQSSGLLYGVVDYYSRITWSIVGHREVAFHYGDMPRTCA